ncbi:MAG: RsmD family RNA methyltransferase [Solirubrobacterales bacterium]
MRVAGGELRGRRLHAPRGVRPTTERVREALFSILVRVEGARVLDLFCGSGALGIEALSRGAGHATLVDTSPEAARRNAEELGLTDRTTVVRSEALRFLDGEPEGVFDLVFCDPPYKLADRLAANLDPLISRSIPEGGRVIAESSPDAPLEFSLPLRLQRAYGDTQICLYEKGYRE